MSHGEVCLSFPLVEEILEPFSAVLGADRQGYRNHVYRALNYFAAVTANAAIPGTVTIAAAFHDLGIWTDRTFDYIGPSIKQAKIYLAACNLGHLEPEVHLLIEHHHKLHEYRDRHSASVEAYRKADLIDLSLGIVRFGISRSFIRRVRAALPDAGFHKRLLALTARQLLRSPWRPLPMLRW